MMLAGVIVALTRTRDRLLLQKVKNIFYTLTCRPEKVTKISSDDIASLNTFLTTSLNTELVVTILKGITVLAASSSDKIDNLKDSDMLNVKQTSQIEITSLRIMNAKKWELCGKGKRKLHEEDGDLIEDIVLGALEDTEPASRFSDVLGFSR